MNPHQPSSSQEPGPTYSADRDLYLGGKTVAGDEINAHTVQLVKAENYYAAPHIIPTGSAVPASAIDHFVDRGTVMNDVRAALGRGDTAAIVGVRGMGGVGKTELAKFLAREFESAHPKGLMWIDVNERGLEVIQADMARVLGIELGAGWDAQTRHNALRGALVQSSIRLVVLDGVRASFVKLLSFCLPPAPPCAALITTRRTDLPGVSANRMFPLGVMNETQALELLRSEGPRVALEREPHATAALAKRCGYHPLALTLAAKRLHKRINDSTTPVASFNASESRTLELLSDTSDTIRANIELSVQELDAIDLARYNQLAVFAPSGFSLTGAAAVWGESGNATRNALERMQEGSLVKPVINAPGRFQLHDLLQEFAQEKLARDLEQETLAERAHAEFLIALFGKYFTDNLSTAPAVALEEDNLIQAAEWAKTLDHGDTLALLATKPRNWLLTIFRVNTYWLDWLGTAIQKGITNTELQALTYQALGDAQRFRDEYDGALASYHTAIALFQQVGNRLGEANTTRSIGDVQQFQRNNDAALASYNSALALFQENGSLLGQANTLRAIGNAHQFRGDFVTALENYTAAIPLFQQAGDQLGEANARKGIGDVQRLYADNDAALASYSTALALFQRVGSPLGQANTIQAIGDVYQFRSDYGTALENYDVALALFRQVSDRLGQANTLQSIGQVQQYRDDNDSALASYNGALILYQQIGDRLGQANTLRSLGDIHHFRSENDPALNSYNTALTLFQEVGSSLGQANTYLSLGELKHALKDFAGARTDYENALGLFRSIQNPYSQAHALQLLGDLEVDRGNKPQALAFYEQGAALLNQISMGDFAKEIFGARIKSVQ